MGGRGGTSGFKVNDLGMTIDDIRQNTDISIDFIKNNPRSYGSLTSNREEEFRNTIKKMYEKGFSGLEEGRILDISNKNNNLYIIKENGGLTQYYFSPTKKQRYREEKDMVVIGEKGRKVKEIKNPSNEIKSKYLARGILLRLLPRKIWNF